LTRVRLQEAFYKPALGRPEIDLSNDAAATKTPIPANHLQPAEMQSLHETCQTLHRQPVLPNQFPHHSPFQALNVEDGLQLFKETQRNVMQRTKALLDRRLENKLQVAPPTRLMTLQKIPHYGFSSRSIPSRFDVSPAHTEERL
jgi:hypothetical protein